MTLQMSCNFILHEPRAKNWKFFARTFKLTAAVFSLFLATVLATAPASASPESDCFGFVQGHIPWNYGGATTWAANNVRKLCRGTTRAAEPGRCFDRAVHGGVNWGGGTRWRWENALNLCKGTSNANATISCFRRKVGSGVSWQQAIHQCQIGTGSASAESDCFAFVQGNIPWSYGGATTWAANNVRNLCRGTIRAAEPGRCFDRVMSGGVNWGGGTRWRWKNALNLCKGTNNADATVACFRGKIAHGVNWQQAIAQCNS